MANQDLVRIATKTGMARAMVGDDLRHGRILNANYQPDGRLRPEVAQAVIPMVPIWWAAASLSAGQLTQRVRLPQPGTIEHLYAYVTTPPSGGTLVVILTGQSPTAAVFEIARVSIPAGKNDAGLSIVPQLFPAGTLLGVQLGSPNSAAGLTVTIAHRAEA